MIPKKSLLMSSLQSSKRYVAMLCLAVSMLASTPSHALAEDETEHYDARVQGYSPNVELKAGGNGILWVGIIILGVMCVAVIFKDAKRSHLD